MICIKVPATSANCCIGFDCLGIALSLYNTFIFEETKAPMDKGNMAINAYLYTAEKYHKTPINIKVEINSDVPVARGLGSSSTCILAGILAADKMLNLNLNENEKMLIATELEGHPDNAVPAAIGGMALSLYRNNELKINRIKLANYHFMAIIPDKRIRTEDARKVIPKQIEHEKAVEQAYHTIAFMQALQNGDEEQLYANCVDCLHEPYRKKLIDEYGKIKQLSDKYQIPMWISGSGSTMLFCSKSTEKLQTVRNEITLKTIMLDMDDQGARIIENEKKCC